MVGIRVADAHLKAKQRLDRLGPKPITFAAEADVTILDFLAHRHVERHAQPADEILRLVTVENNRMDHANRGQAGVEIEPDVKRQPLARAALGFMHAVEFHHRTHRAALLDCDLLDFAAEFLERRGFVHVQLRAILQHANQPSFAGDLAPVNAH